MAVTICKPSEKAFYHDERHCTGRTQFVNSSIYFYKPSKLMGVDVVFGKVLRI